jgi:hypothetical protein
VRVSVQVPVPSGVSVYEFARQLFSKPVEGGGVVVSAHVGADLAVTADLLLPDGSAAARLLEGPLDAVSAMVATSGEQALLHVEVDLLNDAGEERTLTAYGASPDEAVAAAERTARRETGDESWTMNEWRAA